MALIKKRFLFKKYNKYQQNNNLIKLILNIPEYKREYDYLSITWEIDKIGAGYFTSTYSIDLENILRLFSKSEVKSIISIVIKNY